MFMTESLDTTYLSTLNILTSCENKHDILPTLAKIAVNYGFKHIAYIALNLPNRSHRDPYIITTYPHAWVDRYIEQRYCRYDPVVTRGLATTMPIDWGEFDLSRKRVKHLFGEAADFGIGRTGLSIPVRGRHGEQALVSFTSDMSRQAWTHDIRLSMRDLQAIAHQIHHMVLRAERIQAAHVRLSPRETECLHWAALGKTTSEIASILALKERTTRFYLEIARHKLDATTITNAVAKAMALNLISIGI